MSSPTGHAVRAVVRRESASILNFLALCEDPHTCIHQARKAVRRLRAVLALAAEASVFKVHVAMADSLLRQLGESLSLLRDAHVVIHTAQLAAGASRLSEYRPWLESRRDSLLEAALRQDPGFGDRASMLSGAMEKLEQAPWSVLQHRQLLAGVSHQRRRVERARRRIHRDSPAEDLHRWRRRLRRLRMQLEAMPELDDSLSAELSGRIHGKGAVLRQLGDRLGWLQDLHVLRELIEREVLPARLAASRDECLVELNEQIAQVMVCENTRVRPAIWLPIVRPVPRSLASHPKVSRPTGVSLLPYG